MKRATLIAVCALCIGGKPSCWEDAPDPEPAPGMIVVGGSAYSDVDNPLGSGIQGVLITIDGDDQHGATSAGTLGLWSVSVSPGEYQVNASLEGWSFVGGVQERPDSVLPMGIVVNEENRAQNESISLLGTMD